MVRNNILLAILFLLVAASLVCALYLCSRHNSRLNIIKKYGMYNFYEAMKKSSIQERPLNEVVLRDVEYLDMIISGMQSYNLDMGCRIIPNDCDCKAELNLPEYTDIEIL